MSGCKAGEQNIIHIPMVDVPLDPRGLGWLFYERMQINKDKIAQVYGPTGEKDTHGELLQRSIRTAISMRKLGVEAGDFISLCTFNHLDSCTPIIASIFLGAKMAPVDPTLSLEDTVQLLKQAIPKVIFVLPEAVELIEKTIEALGSNTKLVVYGNTTKHIPFSDFLLPSEDEASFKPRKVERLEEIAMVFFTSGTSGFPKGILLDHKSFLWQAISGRQSGFDGSMILAYSSPYWTVLANFLVGNILGGVTRLVYPRFDPAYAWHIFNYPVTCIFFNTTQILTMLNQGRPNNLNISSLKDILIGGGAMKRDQMIKVREMFPETRVHATYGQSEVPGIVTTFKPANPRDLEFMKNKPTSCGTGAPGISYKIVDPETEEILGPNQEGELRLKSVFQLTGYHNIDSADVWDNDGWLKTGDIAYYDDDKCFYIVDRIKEMFKFQSWHIAPAVVESVLLTHPAVELAMVIGIPHELDGDHPMGIVVLKSSHKHVTPEEIEKYVEQKVQDRQRLRAGVKVIDSFPMTPTEKISRNKVKKMFLQQKI